MFSLDTVGRAPVLLIAGCGDLGARVGKGCAENAWQVYGLRRNPQLLPAYLQAIAADLTQAAVPEHWPQQIDYVLYAVAADRRDEQAYRQAYVQGLHNLLAWLGARGQKPKRILFVSSTAVYGQSDGSWVDECSPTEPGSFNGKILLEAEQCLAAADVESTVVRLAGLYGADRRALINRVQAGYQVCAEPEHFSNRIHIEDAAGLISYLLKADAQGQRLEGCYLGVDDQPVAQAQVIAWLREQLEVRLSLPAQRVRGVGSKRCSNARAKALGWQPRYPSFIEGYRELLARITR